MEKLDLTQEILKKYGIGFDLVRKGDVLNKSEVRIRDVFNNDKKIDKMSDVFPSEDKKKDDDFIG